MIEILWLGSKNILNISDWAQRIWNIGEGKREREREKKETRLKVKKWHYPLKPLPILPMFKTEGF